MATYRSVHTSFWQDTFVLDLTPEEKYFYIYLMTNSKTTQCGIYEIPKKVMEMETGYNRDTIDKLLARFTEYGKIQYHLPTNEIILLNWIKHNYSESPKVKACIEKELQAVKHEAFIVLYEELFQEFEYTRDTVSIELGEKEKEKENKKKNKKEYAEYVHMTEEEYGKLVGTYGEGQTKKMIEVLDNYKGSKGKIYKCDYRAILNWVIERTGAKPINTPESEEYRKLQEQIKKMGEGNGN